MRRRDVDLLRGTVTVEVIRTKTMAGSMVDKVPKAEAGRRTLSIPSNVLPLVEDHLDRFLGPEPTALLLDGGFRPLRTAWDNARAKVRVGYHFHDYADAGITTTFATPGRLSRIQSGEHPKVVAERLGHTTTNITLNIYSHVTQTMASKAAENVSALIFGGGA